MYLRFLALLTALAPLSACDFTPTLNIDLPEHQPLTVINAVLAVDSVATVQLNVSTDPYVIQSRYGVSEVDANSVVTLLRDGQPVERLTLRPVRCQDSDYRVSEVGFFECGPFVGTVPIEAGGRYTIRAEVPGLATAEGTVTMPRRPVISVEEIDTTADERRQFRVRVQDPAGVGDRYGVSLLAGEYPDCNYETEPPICPETDFVQPRQLIAFSSSDPVLLAAGRNLNFDNNYFSFASVTDASFDGQTWTFVMAGYSDYYYQPALADVLTIQIAALSGDVYDAYQISTFGGQDTENPFIEPVNLPTNVTGGYGLVGGVALAEVTFERTDTRRLGGLARR